MKMYTIPKEVESFIEKAEFGHFINNRYGGNMAKRYLEIINPANEDSLAKVPVAGSDEVDAAVSAARDAFKSPDWHDMSPDSREDLLHRLATLIEEKHETIAAILTLENGKLYAQAKSEVMSAARTFRFYAGWCTKMEGDLIDISLKQPQKKKNFTFLKREAVGVVVAIVPWNFPISIASWKLAPALAAGCTVVLKPSEVCPLSSIYMARLFEEAGFPRGVFNLVVGDGETGALLTTHKNVDKITFTGSTAVGKIIGKSAMENLTAVSLELGGKSPVIVFEDADLKLAAKSVAMGIFRNGGQVCVAGSRAYIQESIFESFLDMLKQEAESMNISDGFDPDSDLGPLVSEAHLSRVCDYIEKADNQLRLKTGGHKQEGSGFYMQPTIFTAEDNNSVLASEEVFGPVLLAIPFSDMNHALSMANDSEYGLSSAVWTKDISKALECVHTLDAGWVFVNSIPRSDPNFPIGGNKLSGLGRELGKEGLYAYTKLKSVNIAY